MTIVSISNEFGRLKSIAVSRPSSYYPTPPINGRQRRENLERTPPLKVVLEREHDGVLELLVRNGVAIIDIPPHSSLPYLFNVRDPAFAVGSTLLLAKMCMKIRESEPTIIRRALCESASCAEVQAGKIEGGDVVVDWPDVYVGISERTDATGFASLGSIVSNLGLALHPIQLATGVLHLDTVMGLLPDRALVMASGFAALNEVCELMLRKRACQVLDDQLADALPTNFLMLDPETVLLASGSTTLETELRHVGYRVLTVEMAQHHRIGGSIRCMTLPLERE